MLTMKAWLMDIEDSDQRLDHNSGVEVDSKTLNDLGVLYYRYTDLAEVNALAQERNYRNRDEVVVSPSSLGGDEAYHSKLKIFFAEHLHEDEEIRYILDGRGFFDVRNRDDQWIRVAVEKNDLLILPPGIYHRFTTDSSDYIHALRLFQDEPKWVPFSRPADDKASRSEYLKSIKA